MNAAPSALNRYAAFPLQSVCSRHVADLAESPIPNQVIFPENEQLLGFDGMEGIVAYPVGEYYRRNRGTSASDHSRTRGRAGCFPHRVGLRAPFLAGIFVTFSLVMLMVAPVTVFPFGTLVCTAFPVATLCQGTISGLFCAFLLKRRNAVSPPKFDDELEELQVRIHWPLNRGS